ncbi:MAG: hypothetical protein ACR2N4_03745 [Jatrophihabitans sp.]
MKIAGYAPKLCLDRKSIVNLYELSDKTSQTPHVAGLHPVEQSAHARDPEVLFQWEADMLVWIILILVVLALAVTGWLVQRWVKRIEDESSYLAGCGRPVIGNAVWRRIRRETDLR